MRLLVSACLLGICARYDGGCSFRQAILALQNRHELIPVCPEQLGGLATPRIPAEIIRGRVYNREGADVTDSFNQGAEAVLTLARRLTCDAAVLKSNSPSCGCGSIHDGTFSGRMIPGDGILTQKLKQAGIPVYSDTDEEIADF